MGHRALVAYLGDDGTFRTHYSHWGAADLRLDGRITPATPFGGENDGQPDYVAPLTALLAGATDGDVAVNPEIADPDDTPIKPDPMAIGQSFDDVIEELGSAWYEALYVVRTDEDDEGRPVMETVSYRVEHTPAGDMLLVNPDSVAQNTFDSGTFFGLSTAAERLAESGDMTEDEADAWFLDAVLDRYADDLSGVVLAASPAIRREHVGAYPCAFLRFSGRSRVLGEMYPTNIRQPHPWEAVPDFPSVKTASGDRFEVDADATLGD